MTNWAARLFARQMDQRLKSVGLSIGQMPVLFALGDGAELSQKELTARAAVEQPTMAATLSRMQRDGLVKRRPDPRDGRGSLVSLTPLALEKAQAVREAVVDINARALAPLSEEERRAYLSMLERIVAALDGESE